MPTSAAAHNIDLFIQAFDEAISRSLNRLAPVEHLYSAARYVISSGKRIRPRLAATFYRELSGGIGELNQILPICIALELLHNASLVHDDLPALDNDAMRRGRNTCHIEFGESTAILLGDVLVPIAIEQVQSMALPGEIRAQMVQELARSYTDLCLGQQLDISSSTCAKEPDLMTIATLKTGALFRATFTLPALALNLSSNALSLCADIGIHCGVSFQICDDYADLYSVERKGRSESSDKRNTKDTFFSGQGQRDALKILRTNVEAIRSKIEKLQGDFTETRAILREVFSTIESEKIFI